MNYRLTVRIRQTNKYQISKTKNTGLPNYNSVSYDIGMYKGQKVGAVVVAAGTSRRMGGMDKIWTTLAGKPLLFWVLAIFQNNPFIDELSWF